MNGISECPYKRDLRELPFPFHHVRVQWEDSSLDLPGSPVVKNLPCNAVYVGSILGQGTKIPRATELRVCVPQQKSWVPRQTQHSQIDI